MTTYWTYFSLLMWKNFLIKFRHKKEFIIEIIVPLVFCSLLLFVRFLIITQEFIKPTIYEPIAIDSLDALRTRFKGNTTWEIYYSPKNALLENLVGDAAASLELSVQSFKTENELEKHMMINETFVGVVFDEALRSITSYPKNFAYTLKFPGALRTAHMFTESNKATWLTKNIFPIQTTTGPRNQYDSDGGTPPGYLREGFIAVQNAISSSYIKLAAKNANITLPNIVLQRYPYPAYIFDPLITALESMIAVIIILSFVYPCIQAVKYVTSEKQKQLKEAMKMMGLTTTLHWLAWFFTLWMCLIVTVIFIVGLLKIPWFKGFTASIIARTSWSLLFVYLVIYVMSTVTFSFMVSSFFTKASVAGAVAGLVWFLFYIPYSLTLNNFIHMPLSIKLGLSIFMNTSMSFGLRIMLNWESANIGAQWSNLFKTVTVEDNVSLGHTMIMMIIDTIIYMLITLYVEKVHPGSYGIPQKWYFPLTRNFWCPRKIDYIDDGTETIPDSDRFEQEMQNNNKVGIRVLNLRKKFGNKVAVDGLSMNMYENQICVLLGHNGAGKTTSISMITGLMPPTSGTAIVNGTDILKDISKVRQSLGFCPQHNILFDELTVKEHIVFFSRLKGLNKDQVEAEVTKYLKILDFDDKRDAQSHTLSGGMKRKLSVGVALCGKSKVVLCDEPSSGMDPAARRALWDLLLTEKKGRTILLTTHFMNEADVLGDRIAIMSNGKLSCSGTPFFLKKKFGAGYQLICSKRQHCNTKNVTELIRKYIPEIEVKTDVGMELSYQLPEKYVNIYEDMLKDLEGSQEKLLLNGYGISMTTLEDVFMKTGNELSSVEINDNVSSGSNGTDNSSDFNGKDSAVIVHTGEKAIHAVGSFKRLEYQWRAMFLKKLFYFIRNWYLFMIQLLIPLFFIVLSIYITKSLTSTGVLPPLLITLNSYGDTTTILQSLESNVTLGGRIGKTYEHMFDMNKTFQHLVVTKTLVEEYIIALEQTSLFTVNTHYMVAATITTDKIIGWFNNEALHTAPLTLNLIHNAIAKTILGIDYSLKVTNDPLPFSAKFRLEQMKNASGLGFQLALNLAFAMAFVSAMFIMIVIKERVSRAKLLQFVSGVRLIIFWTAHLLWDFMIYIIITIFVVLLMLAFQQEGFSKIHDLQRIFVIFVVYGFATLPFTYLVSFLYEDAATGLSRLSICNIFTGNALYVVVLVLSLPAINLENTGKMLQKIFMIFPNFSLAQALTNQATLTTTINICESTSELMEISMDTLCAILMPDCCKIKPFGWSNPGIGMILVYMFAGGCFWYAVLIIFECLSTSVFRDMLTGSCRPMLPEPSEDGYIDDDVLREKQKVAKMEEDGILKHNLVMRDVTKFYDEFLAVNQISVAIPQGECFGLLGINGAGKTTAFKMLTGDVNMSYGNICVNGYNLKSNITRIYEMIGYCPQFDALFDDLTGMETLLIFSLLRGIPAKMIDSLIKRLSKDLAFDSHLNKKTRDYSGGNRRKLSTAVALLGNPHVVYLDEPTAGIDPASRRKLWDMVCFVRDLGKGIILTSHSMEECEALCTRIAIMVNGEFKCLGSTQHIKNKFSLGISLSIKLEKNESIVHGYYDEDYGKQPIDLNRTELDLNEYGRNVFKFMNKHFPGAILKDSHKNLLTFDIPSNILPYSAIFGLIESNKKSLHIEDYSISQATLEQVFLNFARKQRKEDDNKKIQ